MPDILPRKFTSDGAIHLVHLSSPVEASDRRHFAGALAHLRAMAARAEVFGVETVPDDPWYLAGSAESRLQRFRDAIPGADWLCPVYGGTGCADVVRRLNETDIKAIAAGRPVITGFSDTTFLINYAYFRAGLRTFHAANGAGLGPDGSTTTLLAVLRGERQRLAYREQGSAWIASPPEETLEGIAIGGNLTTFRDLLDVTEAGPEDWSPYVLFIEDLGVDVEDVHRMLVSLDARGVFDGIRGLVVGRIDEPWCERVRRFMKGPPGTWRRRPVDLLTSVLRETLAARERRGDPLSILRVDRFGHGVESGSMMVPIGARATLSPDRTIEFIGPFVS